VTVELAQAARDGELLIGGQLLDGQPGATLTAEEVAHRRASLEVALQHRRDLVLDLRAALDQAAPPRDQAAQGPHALIADPDPGDQVGGQQLGEHARVELVGLDARVADRPHLLGVREHDLGDVRRNEPCDGERVASRLEHHAVVCARLWAKRVSSSGVVATRPAERARPPSAIATSQKSRCTSKPIELPMTTSPDDDSEGGGGRERHLRIRAHERTRAGRRGGQLHQRARSPSSL
jgi:hypothetical protein